MKTSIVNVRGPLLCPDILRVKLTYSDLINPTGAIFDIRYYAGNDIYDPDVSGVGESVQGFAQWGSFYNVFRVYASSISIEAVATSTANPAIIGVFPNAQLASVVTFDLEDAIGTAYSKYMIMGRADSQPRGFVKNFMTTKKMFGLKSVNQEEDFAGTTPGVSATSPTSRWTWALYWGSIADGTNATFKAIVKITYYVQFEDRLVTAQT